MGVSISRHYSGGELYSVAIYGEAESCCEDPSDCCDDESEFIQFAAKYLNAPQENLDNKEIIIDLFSSIKFTELSSVNDEKEIYRVIYPIDSHPPRETTTYLAEIQTFLL